MKRVNEKCVACLYDKQENSMESVKDKVKAQAYLEDVKSILDNRNDNDCAPYLVACFKEKYKEYFCEAASNQKKCTGLLNCLFIYALEYLV